MQAFAIGFTFFIGGVLASLNETLVSNRTSKFIGWWGIGVVRFENSICPAANGLTGICYTRRQCVSIGGYPSGKCAKNIGVCCVVQVTCGGTSSNNNTYFSNPSFPSVYTGATACTLNVQRCNPDICQIRIDLLSFILAQPNSDGVCANDAMVISGAAANPGRICGENTGQHVYLDFDGDKEIVINVFTSAAVALGRQWNLRVAQIECGSSSRAPSGCLMYYTEVSGSVRSFNYAQTVTASTVQNPQGGTRQLASMNYGICIRTAPGFCSIAWSASSSNPFAFSVTGDQQTGMQTGATNCITDYVIIPDGSTTINGLTTPADRFCGSSLSTVTSLTRPFVLYAITDANELADTENRGFSLSYNQQQCTNNFL